MKNLQDEKVSGRAVIGVKVFIRRIMALPVHLGAYVKAEIMPKRHGLGNCNAMKVRDGNSEDM